MSLFLFHNKYNKETYLKRFPRFPDFIVPDVLRHTMICDDLLTLLIKNDFLVLDVPLQPWHILTFWQYELLDVELVT